MTHPTSTGAVAERDRPLDVNIPGSYQAGDETWKASAVQGATVTPEMIRAGVVAYMTAGIDPETDLEGFLVVIWRAMLQQQHQA